MGYGCKGEDVVCETSRSAILLDEEKSAMFRVERGVAQGCSLSPILFSVFINGLLKDVEEAGLGIEINRWEECCLLMDL